MATTKFGEIELDDTELAEMGRTALETLGPLARYYDLANFSPTKAEAAAVDREHAEMARMIIAAFMAKGGTVKKAAKTK